MKMFKEILFSLVVTVFVVGASFKASAAITAQECKDKATAAKVSYVTKAVSGGKTYVVGSGIYDVTKEDIKKQFPTDAIYEE